MGPEQKGAGMISGGFLDSFGTDDVDVEQIETIIEQINTVVNRARKAEDMAETIRPFRPAVECQMQVVPAEAAGAR
jgi:hypothetical protein